MTRPRQRYGVLLMALTASFLFQGIAAPGDVQRAVGTVLLGASLMLALYAAETTPRLFRAGAVVVALVVGGVLIATLAGRGQAVVAGTAIANGLLVAVAPPAVVAGVLRNVREIGTVTVITVAGVLCLYLLAGMFFAFVFSAIQGIDSAPFFANGATATSAHSVYFSFVTLATVGYGDYTARTNLGHTLSISEALLGQIYLVTVVATIIGRLVPRRFTAGD